MWKPWPRGGSTLPALVLAGISTLTTMTPLQADDDAWAFQVPPLPKVALTGSTGPPPPRDHFRPSGSAYDGPIFDTHVRIEPPTRGKFDPEGLLPIVDAIEDAGVVHVLLSPGPHDGRSRYRDLGLRKKRQLQRMDPDTFMGLCAGDFMSYWLHRTAREGFHIAIAKRRFRRLARALDSDDCRGAGEIAPYRFPETPGAPLLHVPMNYPPFMEMVRIIADSDNWIVLHADPITPEGRNYAREVFGGLELLFRKHPNLRLILSSLGMTDSTHARRLLARHPGLMMDLRASMARRLHKHLPTVTGPQGQLLEEWAQLMEDYPDRFVIATAARFHAADYPLGRYEADIRWLRRILGGLDPEVAQRIAHANARQFFIAGRRKAL